MVEILKKYLLDFGNETNKEETNKHVSWQAVGSEHYIKSWRYNMGQNLHFLDQKDK